MGLSHFGAMVLFAVLVTVATACVGRRTLKQRIQHAAWSLAGYLLIGVGIAWLMYPLSR
jgi:hypothetical protein